MLWASHKWRYGIRHHLKQLRGTVVVVEGDSADGWELGRVAQQIYIYIYAFDASTIATATAVTLLRCGTPVRAIIISLASLLLSIECAGETVLPPRADRMSHLEKESR